MLIPLFFLWEWAYWKIGLNPYNNSYLNKLQEFLKYWRYAHWFDKTIAPYLKSFLFARRSEKSFSRTEIPFQSTQESRKSQVTHFFT